MPLAVESYTLLQLLAAIFGLTFASSFSFTPIILVRLVDLDDFTCAYGKKKKNCSNSLSPNDFFFVFF